MLFGPIHILRVYAFRVPFNRPIVKRLDGQPGPHGGFGLGVERTVAWLIRERHIRQCIPFPRLMDKVYI
jgi:hypothetical protein